MGMFIILALSFTRTLRYSARTPRCNVLHNLEDVLEPSHATDLDGSCCWTRKCVVLLFCLRRTSYRGSPCEDPDTLV
jgi:hypothetical protein